MEIVNTSFPFIKKFYITSFVLFLLISMIWASCSRNWDNPFDQNKDGESGNNPPSMPIFLSPANNSTGQSISAITLEWNASIDPDGDSVTYDIYFGTTNPPGLDVTNYFPTTLTKTNLNFETVYYWQIVAKDNHGASTNGSVWNFKTMTLTIPPNPVAYYPFNGNANDESGNGNNGTVFGAILATDRFGNNNSAYDFDGIDDYINSVCPKSALPGQKAAEHFLPAAENV